MDLAVNLIDRWYRMLVEAGNDKMEREEREKEGKKRGKGVPVDHKEGPQTRHHPKGRELHFLYNRNVKAWRTDLASHIKSVKDKYKTKAWFYVRDLHIASLTSNLIRLIWLRFKGDWVQPFHGIARHWILNKSGCIVRCNLDFF